MKVYVVFKTTQEMRTAIYGIYSVRENAITAWKSLSPIERAGIQEFEVQ